ncbi:hypothetical protein H9Y04_31690 [Streptomyces sp. TRM66268-LWL]|uniref:MarR family transcriptional regulator n=1 Tax=Streptomyces polyasparticus TaxID=2767826 RepID=A0ABR7SQC5_9ACTN|nr:hypothetical protein [Streptomyces polyasparticus]MBC9717104.1 hypothetical protein [Streptomyces polyasparticus]
MAYENSNAPLPSPAHPMANPGYGKRSVRGQEASFQADFSRLPIRAAYIAAFIDRLPEGAAMDAKSLAKTSPLYGQQAVRGALNELSRAGHLRRVRRLSRSEDGGFRWVSRTLWSRTAQDDEWWTRYLGADERRQTADAATDAISTGSPSPDVDAATAPAPRQAPVPAKPPSSDRSTAYAALAQLGEITPKLALSAADCATLADLAAQWLERGATVPHLTQALTADLPEYVQAPRGFVRHRLLEKVPPKPSAAEPRSHHTIMECTKCGIPGRPEALPEGLCGTCRSADPSPDAGARRPVVDARRHAAELRHALTAARAPRPAAALSRGSRADKVTKRPKRTGGFRANDGTEGHYVGGPNP